jgi:hypothetical protein
VGLGGQVGGGGQVGVHGAVAGTAVREGVGSLSHGGSDVGLLPSVAPGAVCGHVLLLSLRRGSRERGCIRGEEGLLWEQEGQEEERGSRSDKRSFPSLQRD